MSHRDRRRALKRRTSKWRPSPLCDEYLRRQLTPSPAFEARRWVIHSLDYAARCRRQGDYAAGRRRVDEARRARLEAVAVFRDRPSPLEIHHGDA